MYYTYIGPSGSSSLYTVTLKLFMKCNSGRQFPNPAIVSVFNKETRQRLQDISVNITSRETLTTGANVNPCITDPPTICYEVAYYTFSVSVPVSSEGFLLASEVNYRIRGIANINNQQVGATYTCELPGSGINTTHPKNGSARFTGSDLVIVCSNNYFSYSFGATDPDADEVRYSFCSAYASTTNGINGAPAGQPPYNGLSYNLPTFGENAPLGNKVAINSSTGLISGVAPAAGIYVVTVCAEEIRDNVVIAMQRKDVQINITDCSIAGARLEDDYSLCKTSRALSISNLSNSPLIRTYEWSVYNSAGTSIFTSQAMGLDFTFPADGLYNVRLIVNKGDLCADTASAPVYVFPGLVTDFSFNGICIGKPTSFLDRSSSPTGSVIKWSWDFGEPSAVNDISSIRNPVYTYPQLGDKNMKLFIELNNGCKDTLGKVITIIEKPPITLAFRDTLICLNDRLLLQASGSGAFQWSPNANMLNANTGAPTVQPAVTTKYFVDLNSDGCVNRDSLLVRVVDHVTLNLMNDTTICTGDTIQLRINSDGLRYTWTPGAQVLNDAVSNPFAITPATTTYGVTAVIGGCTAAGSIRVATVNYPLVNAGRDTVICFDANVQLAATTNGSNWTWNPQNTLRNENSLTPTAHPLATTTYRLTAVSPASGCPKSSVDEMVVAVLPKINPFAGNDTAVVVGQPLQLNASGGETYQWLPSTLLSAANIANPEVSFSEPSTGITYRVLVFNSAGCIDSSDIVIKVFGTGPTVFVPTAFTPNGDGRNDILRPIAAGIKNIEYFSVFNRWGQQVFQTQRSGMGWDGRINGQLQSTNSYVWVVKATDYNGKAYFQKGQVTLIR
jgi:gliding motility-associated-like protein